MVASSSALTLYSDGNLNPFYNDTIYNQQTNCRSGDLEIINNTFGKAILFNYQGLPTLDASNTEVRQSPNDEPKPTLSAFTPTSFTLNFNCPTHITDYNYYNKVEVHLPGAEHVSFLLNCDPGNRHKPFEYGYLILSIINAAIIIGVAMHSHIWSI